MREWIIAGLALTVACAQSVRDLPREKAIAAEVRRICAQLSVFESLSDLEQAFGKALSHQIDRVENPHVQDETVRIHALEFQDASAQVIEAPSGSRAFAVSRLRVAANLPGVQSSRWIGVSNEVLRSQIGYADDDSGAAAGYFCDHEAINKIEFSFDDGAVREISWYPYVD